MKKKTKKQIEAEAEHMEQVDQLTAVAVALIKGAAPHIDEEKAYDALYPFYLEGFRDLDEAVAVGEMVGSGVTSGTLQ